MALTNELKSKFLSLASALSPENLHCDGEISRTAAMRRKRAIMAEWKTLEKQAGQKVSEDNVWHWTDEVDAWERDQRDAEIAAQPQHPLLRCKKVGVWVREGKSGQTAYYIWGPDHGAEKSYSVFSEFAYRFGRSEKIAANLQSLSEAVAVGEAFLATVNAEFILAKYPEYRHENIARELERLPEGY